MARGGWLITGWGISGSCEKCHYMSGVEVEFHSSTGLRASFKGVVEPDGVTGHRYSGTVRATCMLDRSSRDFANTVALGSGGTSAQYTYLENETADFRIGINTGAGNQFEYGQKATAAPGGPPRRITKESRSSRVPTSSQPAAHDPPARARTGRNTR